MNNLTSLEVGGELVAAVPSGCIGLPPDRCRACPRDSPAAGLIPIWAAHDDLVAGVCPACGLVQLLDSTVPADRAGCPDVTSENSARQDQAAGAICAAFAAGLLPGGTVREYPVADGGTWQPLLADLGYREAADSRGGPADVVVDNLALMHEPDQRAAFADRAQATSPGGVLLLHYRSLAVTVRAGRWSVLQPGHFAYYSMTALVRLLANVGMSVVAAWELDAYGGTVLLAAIHAASWPPEATVGRILSEEHRMDITAPEPGRR